jgi:hypothetical protein
VCVLWHELRGWDSNFKGKRYVKKKKKREKKKQAFYKRVCLTGNARQEKRLAVSNLVNTQNGSLYTNIILVYGSWTISRLPGRLHVFY